MDLKLENKLALVTGSTAGIGYATAAALLHEGARVVINGRTQAAVDEALAKLKDRVDGARVMGFPTRTGCGCSRSMCSRASDSRAYVPGMRRRDWGRIIFISSESALQIPAEMVHYGMTKAAQVAVARGLAESLAGTRITVNSVLGRDRA